MKNEAQNITRMTRDGYIASSLIIMLVSAILASIIATTPARAAEPTSGEATPVKNQTRDALEYFFHQSFKNLEEEADIAREEGQIALFVMFNDPDCPWCQKMKATVMNQVRVQDYYRKHFRVIHLDTTGDTMMADFDGTEVAEKDYSFKKHRVRATPVFMFFDLEGNKILRYTGATRSIDEFLWLGEFVVSGEFKNKRFSSYKRERLAKNGK